MAEVAVVGAGPAGSLSARLLAASGREVVVLEEHRAAGAPVHCAGIVTDDVIEMTGVRPDILSTVCGADVVFPDGRTLSIDRQSPIAYAIDRKVLDERMADAAAQYGAVIRWGDHCTSYSVDAQGVTLNTNSGQIRSEMMVGADGQGSLIAVSLGDNAPREVLRGAQADVRRRSEHPDRMVLRMGSATSPGFFSWEVPMGDHTRIGVCVGSQYGMPAAYLKKVMDVAGYADAEVMERYGGKIPIGGRRTTFSDRLLLIGDAAGQVKAVSGGGLYPICKAAPILRDVVNEAFEKKMFSSAQFALYERGWKRELDGCIRGGIRLRKMYTRLSDDGLNAMGAALDSPEAKAILSAIDLDDPTNVVGPLLGLRGVKSTVVKVLLKAIL